MSKSTPVEWLQWFGIHDDDIQRLKDKHNGNIDWALDLAPQQASLVSGLGYAVFCDHMLGLKVEANRQPRKDIARYGCTRKSNTPTPQE